MSDLVGNPKDQFSCVMALILCTGMSLPFGQRKTIISEDFLYNYYHYYFLFVCLFVCLFVYN